MPETEKDYVTVVFEGKEGLVELKPMSTVEEIRMSAVFEHGLPTPRHEDFTLLNFYGRELPLRAFCVMVGMMPGDRLELKYAGADGGAGDERGRGV